MQLEHFKNLTEALMSLPAVGKKSARNIALNMVTNDRSGALRLSHAIEQAVANVRICTRCGNLSEHELCAVCADDRRDRAKLCVVLSAKDIFTIEESGFYKGLYFVYASEESFAPLEKMAQDGISEVIFAFAPSVQNDALIYFIEERLLPYGLNFSKIAQGVPTGVSLENVDMLSLARALEGRVKI
ncbi:recombination protein RecR [Campylobacterota bacterium]|nr:recombination protein RecR [Campylobacterota bacterium]GHV02920.1 recombination protein RecR [Campylobacterota bacterium]